MWEGEQIGVQEVWMGLFRLFVGLPRAEIRTRSMMHGVSFHSSYLEYEARSITP